MIKINFEMKFLEEGGVCNAPYYKLNIYIMIMIIIINTNNKINTMINN